MTEAPRPRRPALDLEPWLRSPWRRLVVIAVLVLVATAATTWQVHELFSGRRDDVDVAALFARQLVLWSAWALLGFPLVALAFWTARRLRYWPLFLLVQVPLSLGVAYGFARLEPALYDTPRGERPEGAPRLDGPQRPERGEVTGPDDAASRETRGDRRDRFRDGASRRGRFARFRSPWIRMPRLVLTYWVVLGIGAGIVGFLRTRDQERRAAELELRAARLRAELAEVQIDTLRKELNPHFLFNALHTVGGLVRADESEAALQVLAGIGDLLRSTLDQGKSQVVPLREELALARRYLEIEGVRFGERMTVEVRADEDVLDAPVPALLLLPIVENAVKYAVEPRTGGGRVTVEARRARPEEGSEPERDLVLVVADDGPGFPPDVLAGRARAAGSGRSHIGLTNVRRRLEMIYGSDGRVRLENTEPGARVVLRLPSAGPGAPTEAPEPPSA